MWYKSTDEKVKIDFNKPIVASDGTSTYLLVPKTKTNNYTVTGYDWFNINTGSFNSCRTFETAQKAIDCYKGPYNIYNAEIKLEKVYES